MSERVELDPKALEAANIAVFDEYHSALSNGATPGARTLARAAIRAYLAAILPPPAGDGMQPVAPYADVGFGSLLINAAMANLKDYVFSPDEGSDHEPTEFERVLIEDWFMGLTSDTPVNDLIVKANAALFPASPLNAVPDGVREPTGWLVKRSTGDGTAWRYEFTMSRGAPRWHDLADEPENCIPLYASLIVPSPPEGVTVKPLVWRKIGKVWWSADSVVGEYLIERVFWEIGDNTFEGRFKVGNIAEHLHFGAHTLDEAKTAVQSDYERRIKSALEPSPSNSRAKAMEAGPRIRPHIIDTLREWAEFEQDGGNVEQGAAIDIILDWYDRQTGLDTRKIARSLTSETKTP